MNPGTEAGFHSACELRVVEDCGPRPIVELTRPLVFESGIAGAITVPAGFRFDGASIPQVAMGITGWPGIRAACVHDWLLLQPGYDRRTADLVFREALAHCGVGHDLADLMFRAVRAYSRVTSTPAWPDDERVGA